MCLNRQTLSTISLDTLKSTFGYRESASTIVSDNRGNTFIGGTFEQDLFVNSDTLQSAGGDTDFFIAKFGNANCGNIMPLKLLSFTAKGEGKTNLLQWSTASRSLVQFIKRILLLL